jgi:RNA polymerase sigma-70 factor (ECF subfamily)
MPRQTASKPTDEQLVAAYLEGDQKAFEELVERYKNRIYNLAYRMLGNAEDAYDLVQEVFLLLVRKLPSFRGESRFSTWLYRVALNACYDRARKGRNHLSLQESPGEDLPELGETLADDRAVSPEENMERAEIRSRVQEAISKLPPKFRQVVVLHDIQGYDYREVAEILGISLGTVKSRLNRARNRLARELSGYWAESAGTRELGPEKPASQGAGP